MRATTDKDYIDARDAALMAASQELYARTEARMSEMETRLLHAMADMHKWVAGIVIAGITVTTSVMAYMQNSTLNQMQAALGRMQTEIRRIQTPPAPAPAPPVIIYAQPAPPQPR
jgi:hypothetical protein